MLAARHKLVTAPTKEPVEVAELKNHLNLQGLPLTTEDETLLALCLLSARRKCEEETGLALLTQTWDFFYDEFPESNDEALELPVRPVQSTLPAGWATQLRYVDSNGVTTDWATTLYTLDVNDDRRRSRIFPAYNQSWPTARDQRNAVNVRVIVGWTVATGAIPAANVPAELRAGIKLLAADLWNNREASDPGAGGQLGEIPIGIDRLWQGWRLREFA